jgi:hypothetical protein
MTKAPDEVDMSPAALARRLDEMRALYDLMKYLERLAPLVEAADNPRRGT